MIHRILDHGEQLLKGVLFGCQGCGQCVLRANKLICPMTCPKGLRNGPCGGTLGSRCEVHSDRPCVHVRIHGRRHAGRPEAAPIMPAIDWALARHASLVHACTGADHGSRDPLPALVSDPEAVAKPCQTSSKLEATLKGGRFAVTTEIRAPRGANLDRVRRDAAPLLGRFDGVNATAYLAGNPSLPSGMVAAELVRMGLEPIAQATGRDQTRTTFVGELFAQQASGVHNLLCLTGDWRTGRPMVKPVYEMDSGLMLYQARHLRDRARIQHTGEEVANQPRPFLGTAINPLSDPIDVPVRRLRLKADCGADFAQTQVLTEARRLASFMELARAQGLHRRVFILAGIPVVVSRKALEHLGRVAGVQVDPAFRARLDAAADIRQAGIAEAIALVRAVRTIPGIAGVHLMLFGADHRALTDVRAEIPMEESCLSPA